MSPQQPQQQMPKAVYAQPVPQDNSSYSPPAQQQQAPQVQTMADPRLTMRGVPPERQQGGIYDNERYCGILSVVVCLIGCPCVICCPVDQREVWKSPEGRKVILN
ncbi:Hypothetical Protein FCC1311_024962 [Hondaea fermentalgiana]|uniref:Uncharacterized protein n=1 Tax=Hondaea fermentalgiana TaxID=2315210 RepID=A0A2R5G6X3_9STRA|nr:Hypothetical Protein FCC1311_024962 [Hondaea fermentalgiana]|eukprot:GBG26275.1 Hypothetical Protein FCC1311_024962 [Hondaea fermentalgiana]